MRVIRVVLGLSLLVLLAVLATPVVTAADKTPSSPAYPYDITGQRIVSGVVIDVQDYECPVSGTVGSHITVRHAGGTVEVHLAPAKFLKQYEIVISKGDQVHIEGAMTTVDGNPALLAKIVTDGNSTFAFRDAKGRPLW